VSFAPAVGGPVTLTTGALTFEFEANLSGTDSLVATGLMSEVYSSAVIRLSGSLDAYGGLDFYAVDLTGTTLNNYGAATRGPKQFVLQHSLGRGDGRTKCDVDLTSSRTRVRASRPYIDIKPAWTYSLPSSSTAKAINVTPECLGRENGARLAHQRSPSRQSPSFRV
jgi:hypothetical protein